MVLPYQPVDTLPLPAKRSRCGTALLQTLCALLRGDGREDRPTLFYLMASAVWAGRLLPVMLFEVENLGEAFLAGFADKLVVGHTHLPTFVAEFYTRDGRCHNYGLTLPTPSRPPRHRLRRPITDPREKMPKKAVAPKCGGHCKGAIRAIRNRGKSSIGCSAAFHGPLIGVDSIPTSGRSVCPREIAGSE